MDDIALSRAALRVNGDHRGDWVLSWFFECAPDRALMTARFEGAPALSVSPESDDWSIETVDDDVNWLEQSYRQFQPFSVGGFFIYGSHYEGGIPGGAIGLQIDAATAFGSGEHGTTAGCLLALEFMKQSGNAPGNILDMGTGSGILAIAAAILWPEANVLAVDIEEEAVRVAERHAVLNNIAESRVLCRYGDGFDTPDVRTRAPFDLIVANILAGPLVAMADDLTGCLAAGGHILLSGMLHDQADEVLTAYEKRDATLVRRYDVGDWSSLLLRGSA